MSATTGQTRQTVELINRYLAVSVPGSLRLEAIRELLTDDVVIDDPMMAIEGADAFVEALSQTPSGGGMTSTVQDVVADGSVAAARVLFEAGDLVVQFAQWFWVTDGRIARIQVVYDPRPFLAAAG